MGRLFVIRFLILLTIFCIDTSTPAFKPSITIASTPADRHPVNHTINADAETLRSDPAQTPGNPITCVFNTILYVGEGGCVAGSDIGAQINAAYGSLPPQGGEIAVLPQSNGNCYVDTTQVYFGTPMKFVSVHGFGGNIVCIQYTPTSGSLFTFNNANGSILRGTSSTTAQAGWGTGMRNLILTGPGKGTSVAITLGGPNGCQEGQEFYGLDIEWFHIGITQAPGNVACFGWTLAKSAVMNNDQEVVFPNNQLGQENITFDHVKVGNNSVNMPPNCLAFDNGTDIKLIAVSLDSCQMEMSNGSHVDAIGDHFENIVGSPSSCQAYDFIVLNRGMLNIYGGWIANDCTSGPISEEFITTGTSTGNQEYLNVFGMQLENNHSGVLQFIKQQGAIQVNVQGLTIQGSPSFANGLVNASGATGPTIVGPTTTGIPGTGSYTNFIVKLPPSSPFNIGGEGGLTLIDGTPFTASPRTGCLNSFLAGPLTIPWTGGTCTLDRAITVTRVQVTLKAAPVGCATTAVVQLTDGTTPINVIISAATNDSGPLTQDYAENAVMQVRVSTGAVGCEVMPSDANVNIQYRMQ
jgi:hypothetical protein